MASIKSNGLECFFFCTLDKDPNRRCNNRKIAEGKKGFWHRTGNGRPPQENDKFEWAKRIFYHRVGTHRSFEQTDWVMHEFSLISDESCVLNDDIIAKKAKNNTDPSQDHNQFLPEAISSEASSSSSETNTAEGSDIWTTLLNMANTYTPELDINLILKQL